MPTIQRTRLKPKFISMVAIVSLGFVSGAISGTMAQTSALDNANNSIILPPPPPQDSTLAELQDKILNQINHSKNTTSDNTNIDNPPNVLNALSQLSNPNNTTPSNTAPKNTAQKNATPNILNALSSLDTTSTPKTIAMDAPKARITPRAVGGDWDNTTTLTYDTTKGEVSGTYTGTDKLTSNGSNKDLTITQGTSATRNDGSIIEVTNNSKINNFTNPRLIILPITEH